MLQAAHTPWGTVRSSVTHIDALQRCYVAPDAAEHCSPIMETMDARQLGTLLGRSAHSGELSGAVDSRMRQREAVS